MRSPTQRIAAAVGLAAFLPATSVLAATIAGTSFEEPAAVGGQYIDTLGSATDHALLDNPGEPVVNYAGGTELGFSSFYTNTRGDVGLTDGDFVGVTNYTGDVGAYTDGVQGFEIQDSDGLMTTTVETFDLTGLSSVYVAVDVYVNETGWESDDRIRVWATVDGGVEIDLLNTAGSDIDDLGIEGAWMTVSAELSGYTTATLSFEVDSNSSSESVYFDDVRFTDEPPGGGGFELGACGDPATPIHDIQGNGDFSPLEGQQVAIEGIVVGDFQVDGLRGFFVQEETPDADPATSEGIFIYDGGSGIDVAEGQRVRIGGTVQEYFDLTELSSLVGVLDCGPASLPVPAPVAMPEAFDGELEQYEGMLIEIADPMVVSQNYFLGRYGQMTLASMDDAAVLERLYNPTNQYRPLSPEALALEEENARRLLVLDDGMDLSKYGDNPDPVPYLGPPPPQVIRAGDLVTNLVGVLDYGRINSNIDNPARDYRLHPTVEPIFTPENPRTAAPDDVGGSLKVASFNVLNFFTTIDTGAPICGPSGGLGCRGADSESEFERQRVKIIEAMVAIDADVLGLIEIENNATTAVQDLVEGLNDALGAGTYAFVDTGTIGDDAIKVAFIYKPAKVTADGYAILDDSVDPRAITTKNRPALAATFTEIASGESFTAVVNHFKSKGSPCDDIGDPDLGDGQGNCNLTRVSMAQAMVDWLATDPTGSGDPDFLVMGDLNAYAEEDPIHVYLDAGYTNLVKALTGDKAYSYIFDGEAGYLDHALANEALTPQVTGATEWHINTDEPAVIDYDQNFNPDGYWSPDAYRASDHDPVVIGLNLGAGTGLPGNQDGDGDIDILDVLIVLEARGTRADPGDPRDIDGNGWITLRDALLLVQDCTNPGCRP